MKKPTIPCPINLTFDIRYLTSAIVRPAFGLFLVFAAMLMFAGPLAADDYTKEMDKIAVELLKPIPKGKTVVVFNFTKGGRVETQNCIDLAAKLTSSLSRVAGTKWPIIDRATGQQLWYAEQAYTVNSENSDDLVRLLAQFKADVGVIGSYQLFGSMLTLDNIRAQCVPAADQPPKVYPAPARRTLKLSPGDSCCLWALERPLPQHPDSVTTAFLEDFTAQTLATASLEDKDGRKLIDNCVRIGGSYRLDVDVTEDAFLYLFNYDQDQNRTYLLYPTERNPAPVPKGKFQLPDPDHEFQAIPPAGLNSVLVFATRKPVKLDIPTSEYSELTRKDLATFVEQLKSFDQSEWSRYMIFIRISE